MSWLWSNLTQVAPIEGGLSVSYAFVMCWIPIAFVLLGINNKIIRSFARKN